MGYYSDKISAVCIVRIVQTDNSLNKWSIIHCAQMNVRTVINQQHSTHTKIHTQTHSMFLANNDSKVMVTIPENRAVILNIHYLGEG